MTTTQSHGDRPARVLGAVAIGLAALALVMGVLVPRAAIVLGVGTLVCAGIAWSRTDRADRTGRRLAIWGVVLAIVAGLAVGASQSASTSSVGTPSPTATVDDVDGAATDEVLTEGLAIDIGTSSVPGSTVEFSGLPVSVTNVSAAGAAFTIGLEARASDGAVVASDEVAVRDLAVGSATTVWAFQDTDLTAQQLHDATVSVSSVEVV
ncbi:hypothetical protein ACFT5B_13180 [Luteimicrobium sp. NPDC057192]|uniref:hypothetical protein n=1 Tax=Luteimicrobium sp. NPDC057192 TaxID=3346042 RepID=UPI0036294660